MTDQRFTQPEGFAWGSFKNAAGAQIRYGQVKPAGTSRGTTVVLGGFREPLEKYFEVMRENLAAGFAVVSMDWPGQGASGRYIAGDPMKSHHNGFDDQIETLHRLTRLMGKEPGQPLVLMAHSMGAHIGLRYLKEHPGVFDAAVFTAPMLNIVTGTLPEPAARILAAFAAATGFGERYVPGGGPWSEARDVFDGNNKTGDPERFGVQTRAYLGNPLLQMGDPTYGWVREVFRSVDILNDESYLKSIKTPVLMEISGDEKVVNRIAAERASRLLPQCRRVDIPGAKHEIWMEQDKFRGPWRQAVNEFLASCARGAASSEPAGTT